VQEAPPQPPAAAAPARAACPVCGTPADPGQEFCLSCGNRVTQRYRRPPSWRLVAGALAAAVLAIGAAVGAAIGLSGGHKQSPVETTTTTTAAVTPPPAPTTAPPPAATTPTATTPAKPGTTATAPGATTPGPTPGKPTTPAFPGAAVWPAGTTAYTVDLLETPNQKEAKAEAKTAIAKGISAGVLQSDGYQTLPPGLYVVFAGQYKTPALARSAADGYAKKGFGSAYGRLIKPKA
jgi:predicted nucleic acid-binding Zn ribbon protein